MSKIMFRQRYFLDRTNWAGTKSKNPLIVNFGGEYPVEGDLQNLGVINEAATKFGALVLYIEHRFYGMSVPFGSIDIALGDANVRECLNSEQALEDFPLIILGVRKKLFNQHTKIIVTGCSYAGMLAAWFRLKYPNIAIGALAASAPVFYFEPSIPSQWENEFCSIVSNDFKVVNEKCYQRIRKSWDIIDKISLQELEGSAHLADVFKSCSPFISAWDLKHSLLKYYSYSAQYNGHYNGGIGKVCDEIIRAPDDDVLGGIARSVLNGRPCYDLEYYMDTNTTTTSSVFENNAARAWDWQELVCSSI
ncbi:uncharacterized protein [Spinacia oleracea]|uniref:Serine carboxypeptidase S28 family protein n=1 Tax=Spinacia oleracea TaxID=3562 RepID=A0ABM3RS96_SPIOL|nr:uncharacterized protein LOC110789280 [Spinacia oleracea]